MKQFSNIIIFLKNFILMNYRNETYVFFVYLLSYLKKDKFL